MITRVTGVLNRVLDEEVRLQVGPLEYQVLVPEFVRRVLQNRLGQDLTLYTTQYLEGGANASRLIPRLIGFLTEVDLEFFELFCTVDGVGTKKALKALARPVRDVAEAIQRQDSKWLTTLPGVGRTTGEKIVAAIRSKVVRFTQAPAPDEGGVVAPPPPGAVSGDVLDDAYQALAALGLGPAEARLKLDRVLATGRTFATVQEILSEMFKQ